MELGSNSDSPPFFVSDFFEQFYFPASGYAVVTGVVPSATRFLASTFIADKVQQSQCSSNFHRVLLTHAFAFSEGQFVRKKKFPRIYRSMHSGGFELTNMTYTRLEEQGTTTTWHCLLTFKPPASLSSTPSSRWHNTGLYHNPYRMPKSITRESALIHVQRLASSTHHRETHDNPPSLAERQTCNGENGT